MNTIKLKFMFDENLAGDKENITARLTTWNNYYANIILQLKTVEKIVTPNCAVKVLREAPSVTPQRPLAPLSFVRTKLMFWN